MKKILIGVFSCLMLISTIHAQEHKWAFGLYGDAQVKSEGEKATLGLQGKYDLTNRSALQAQVHGRTDFVSVGADYLFSFLDKKKSNFNVFLGTGASGEFYGYTSDYVGKKSADNAFVLNGQVGVSYYFEPVKLSLFSGYKMKYNTTTEKTEPNFVVFGLRYHLW